MRGDHGPVGDQNEAILRQKKHVYSLIPSLPWHTFKKGIDKVQASGPYLRYGMAKVRASGPYLR